MLCTYLRSDFLTSTSEQVGTISDRECALWIVLVEKPRGLALPRIVFWMPYIVIDTSIGMATGREIWGFRKEIGPVTIPSAEQDPARFVAQATIFRTLQTDTRGRVEPLIRVERDAPLGQDDLEEVERFEQLEFSATDAPLLACEAVHTSRPIGEILRDSGDSQQHHAV